MESTISPTFLDVDAYRGEYADVSIGEPYQISANGELLKGVFTFVKDYSGESCYNCDLRRLNGACATCFNCNDLSAHCEVEEFDDRDQAIISFVNEERVERKEKVSYMERSKWESDLKEKEEEIVKIEEQIANYQAEIKVLKQNLSDLEKVRRDLIFMDSEEYSKNHPLFG